MKKHFLILILLVLVLISGCSKQTDKTISVESSFEFEDSEFDFGLVKQSGGILSHDFKFKYNGTVPIKISSTPGSCACTTAEINKSEYHPGEEGTLTVYFNPNLHAEPEGIFYKSVAVITEPKIEPVPEVKIWQEIDLDLGEEFFELQEEHEDNHTGISH